MAKRGWEHDEPGWPHVRRDLSVLLRGMRRRMRTTVTLSLLIALAAVAVKARKKPTYDADIVIRMTEKGFDENTAPATKSDITKYLYDVALSRTALMALIKEHDLYPSKMFDPTWAVETMKEDISIRVLSNYFSPETYIENPLKEARLVVSYTHTDPEKVLIVTREMGKLIAREQSAVRQEVAIRTAAAGAEATSALEHELLMARRELTELNAIRDKNPLAVVRLRRLTDEIRALEEELGFASSSSARLNLRGELEEKQGGLEFQLVDPGKPPKVVLDTRLKLAIIGVLLFLLSIPVIGIGVAGIDPVIYDRDGVRRLKLRYLGHLPVESDALGGRLSDPAAPGHGRKTKRKKRGKLPANEAT